MTSDMVAGKSSALGPPKGYTSKATIEFFFYLTVPGLCCGMQDLQLWHVGSSSLTRDQTWAPALGAKSFSHWTTRGSPKNIF